MDEREARVQRRLLEAAEGHMIGEVDPEYYLSRPYVLRVSGTKGPSEHLAYDVAVSLRQIVILLDEIRRGKK